MNWKTGYSAAYYMTTVDPVTWRDTGRIEIRSGSINRISDGLRESAAVGCVNYGDMVEQWVRIWLEAKQEGDSARVPLFTGLATSPADNYEGESKDNDLQLYSVLKTADDVALLRGWYAPAGMNGAAVIKDLLSVLPAPVIIAADAPTLSDHIIAEDNETRLTMTEKILKAINWRLKISGDGTVHIEPKPAEPVITFDPMENDVIEKSIIVKADLFNCPNVFMAIDNDLTAIARDDSPSSPLSTVNRGREVWKVEGSCDLADNETIEQYAVRRLKEDQKIQKTASYTRRYFPDIYPGDVIRMHYPVQGLEGDFTVSSQSIELAYSANTSEEITA